LNLRHQSGCKILTALRSKPTELQDHKFAIFFIVIFFIVKKIAVRKQEGTIGN
jgi:hypothetical protein